MLLCGPNGADSVKTNFQTGSGWSESVDARPDGVMVYGFENLDKRAATWREHGYRVQFMTGIAWGGYRPYHKGEWDGIAHLEEVAQRDRHGNIIWHGTDNPYIVPTRTFLEFMKENLRKVVDLGISEIFLEEPELWSRCGYGTAFKNEWKEYYGTDWQPQHESAENMFKANKLKHYLYIRAVEELTSDLKKYAKEKGVQVRCYIATHSLVNYSAWNIVSPESAFAHISSVDGFIAQVWTGTSRYPNIYYNKYRSRIFETALMEYDALKAIALPAGKEIFFLTDPIEDAPRDWADYRKGYEATFTAEIMHPDVARYEVMPWPDRIYRGKFRTSYEDTVYRRIPSDYATQMQIMINSLMTMPVSENQLSGPHGISVLLSNSMMFQRFIDDEDFEDPVLSNYFGFTLPLIKRGVPVRNVFVDNLGKDTDTRILLMTYANMKPLSQNDHSVIASWVEKGGTLVYCGRDNDRFQTINEWWSDMGYNCPSGHLFKLMGMDANPGSGTFSYGKGSVTIIRRNPIDFALEKRDCNNYLSVIKKLYQKKIGSFICSNYFKLERGQYDIYSVLDETITDSEVMVTGMFVDMFCDSLPVITTKKIAPGTQAMLINLDRTNRTQPAVLATAARIYDEQVDDHSYSFIAKGPSGIRGVMRIILPEKPLSVNVDGEESLNYSQWDAQSSTYRIFFNCNPIGTKISIQWKN